MYTGPGQGLHRRIKMTEENQGRNRFNWDDLKDTKDRYNYLGNSLKAPVKKPWNQGPKANWYITEKPSRPGDKTSNPDLQREIDAIKEEEKRRMAELMPKKTVASKTNPSQGTQMPTTSERIPPRTRHVGNREADLPPPRSYRERRMDSHRSRSPERRLR